ncbi:P-loop containing nucleoside triphosphate hydrolase protein [Hypoxylon sp. NC1633]|nr:P-loop containing nucleoside triphosphate hydrolase protein [Hypoxylon sp. NC1633]
MTLVKDISQKTSGFIQSDKHRDLLDIVDSLRSHGVSHYVDLPQIIVSGSQSSGKSSTLESLSGIAFPTADSLCTRFSTELVLRRGEEREIKVHIQLSATRGRKERARFIIEAAKEAMGLIGSKGSKIFSTDILRIESTSPSAPNLTLVDLPGLFGASDKNQFDDDAALPVTKFARDIDPTGERTLGLITKPDRIDPDSESERYYIELAQNLNVKLSLGWHVLRNRGHTTANDTAEERDERESKFFSASAWATLDSLQLGVQSGIQDCRDKLERLGQARSTTQEKHAYLQRISSRLSTLVRGAIDGVYADRFFESYSGQQEVLQKRLRAHVQKILGDYAENTRANGHATEIVEDDMPPTRRRVGATMIGCRGRELPGTFNPTVVGDLFSRQCKPRQAMTRNLVELIHEAAASNFNEIVNYICNQNTKSQDLTCIHHPPSSRITTSPGK